MGHSRHLNTLLLLTTAFAGRADPCNCMEAWSYPLNKNEFYGCDPRFTTITGMSQRCAVYDSCKNFDGTGSNGEYRGQSEAYGNVAGKWRYCDNVNPAKAVASPGGLLW